LATTGRAAGILRHPGRLLTGEPVSERAYTLVAAKP
jgi:hypothetical protein